MQLSLDTVLLRLLAATFLGTLIGWERVSKNKPAGLRKHMLVGLGSAAFFLISIEFTLGPLKDAEGISPDPTRIFQGIITGIGFLGAGAIIQGNEDVTGLTTGAGIWLAGGHRTCLWWWLLCNRSDYHSHHIIRAGTRWMA